MLKPALVAAQSTQILFTIKYTLPGLFGWLVMVHILHLKTYDGFAFGYLQPSLTWIANYGSWVGFFWYRLVKICNI